MTHDAGTAPTVLAQPSGWLPARGWLRGYGGAALRTDVVAGVTLTAYLLPAAIGDASLARPPPESGLYACLFSGLVFWLLCSSRHTAITVTSAISLLLGTSLGGIAGGDPARFAALAAATAIMVAAMSAGASFTPSPTKRVRACEVSSRTIASFSSGDFSAITVAIPASRAMRCASAAPSP